MKDSTKNNITNIISNSVTAATLTKEVDNIAKVCEHTSKIADLKKRADYIYNTFGIPGTGGGCLDLYLDFLSEAAENEYNLLISQADNLQKVGHGVNLFKYFGITTFIGIGVGAYCTHSYCENLINKFAEFYKKMQEK